MTINCVAQAECLQLPSPLNSCEELTKTNKEFKLPVFFINNCVPVPPPHSLDPIDETPDRFRLHQISYSQIFFLFTMFLNSVPNWIELVVLFGIVGSQNSTQTQKHQGNGLQEVGGDRTANSRSKQGSRSAQGDFQTPVFVLLQQVASSSVNGAESDSSGQRRKRSFTGITNYSAEGAQS